MTDLWWYESIGFKDVYWTGLRAQGTLFTVFGVLGIIIIGANLLFTVRSAPEPTLFRPDDPVARVRAQALPLARRVAVWSSVVIGLIAGLAMTAAWRSYLLIQNSVTVGTSDPVFERDLGFYLFSLPFQRALTAWIFGVLIVSLLLSVLGHLMLGGIQPEATPGNRVAGAVRGHLSVLAGLLILVQAFMYRLDQFDLLYSARGQVTGASYTDVNAELPALKLLFLIALVCSLLFFANAWFRNWALPGSGLALLLVTAVIAGGIYPAAVQRFRVTPNERERERIYIERNIKATREAFNLDKVSLEPFPAKGDVTAQAVRDNEETVSNVRLWDPLVLIDNYLNLQRIKQYYEFVDVDVDRYMLDGQLRQVMLSAREISLGGVEDVAQTWLNEHLVYTHGNGIVASRVDRVTTEGQPAFVAQNVPTENVQGFPEVKQARIYFGELDSPYAVVGGEQGELDFPKGEGFEENTYAGKGGISMGSIIRRAAFAWRFGDVNLLISGAISKDAQILFNRSVTERIAKALPFVTPDRDPYITVVDGRLTWIVDGYTTSDMWPYAQRVEFGEVARMVSGSGNYIRNSLKIAVDAEDGSVTAYEWDTEDPILKAWRGVYPKAVQDKSEIPQEMLDHVRYPEGLFEVQTAIWENYHITDADNFYSKEDAWRIALDPRGTGDSLSGQPLVPPYYVLLRLPGEEELEFVLVRPFTPNGRQNMTGYMVAKGDANNFGELVTYQLPKSKAVFGPEQVHARISNDPVISSQLNILDQRGSTVIRGNILIVPIEESLLYVQPIYVRGTGTSLPELKFVVVVSGQDVKFGATLDEALAKVFGDSPPEPGPDPSPEPPSADVSVLLQRALDAETAAQVALREGDFAEYGRQRDRTRRFLEQAEEASRNGG